MMQKSKFALRSDSQQHISLDLTPLIDVVFLLLIFFMLSTSFEKTHWLEVALPSVDERESDEDAKSEPFIIGIDPQGQFHMNEENIGIKTNAELKKYLTEHLTKDPIVVIHGDAKAPHGSVVQLLDILGQLKVSQLHIATQTEE